MRHLACPHCQQRVLDDGELGGQIVACPHCGDQFQMPKGQPPPSPPTRAQVPLLATPIVAEFAEEPEHRPSEDSRKLRRKKKVKSIIASIAVLIIVAETGLLTWGSFAIYADFRGFWIGIGLGFLVVFVSWIIQHLILAVID